MDQTTPQIELKNRSQKGMMSAIINISLNTLLSIIKILTGILGHSYALIADGVESLLDIFSSTIVWGGLMIGSLPPDSDHPFGHGRAESLASMVVSFMLISVSFGIAFQSLKEIYTPHHTPAPFTLIVLIVVILVKEIMYRKLLKTAKQINSVSIHADAWHSRSDALTSLAALIGISIALVGGKGLEQADDWAALFASAIIFINGYKILKTAIDDLMDREVSADFKSDIRDIAEKVKGVLQIEKCRIRKSGLSYFVDIHIVVDGNISVNSGHKIAHDVKETIMKSKNHIIDVMTHIEPDQIR